MAVQDLDPKFVFVAPEGEETNKNETEAEGKSLHEVESTNFIFLYK